MLYFAGFVVSLIFAALATKAVIFFAQKNNILDIPRAGAPRKIHKQPVPLLGGWAIILSFNLLSAIFYFSLPLLKNNLPLSSMSGLWLGGLILAVAGYFDDKKNLKPARSFLGPLLAAVVVILLGVNVPHITNPLGGRFVFGGPEFIGLGLASAAFVLIWVLGMVYTTKLLDGLDGLASGIGVVGALAIFALSFTPQVQQSYTALLAVLAAGSFAGFLIFNWHPAKIFLGESGSTFIGFVLAILAIIAGGKIATAILVMGVPILDVAWVILRRVITGKSVFTGDAGHLHFRLMRLGLSQRQTVALFLLTSVFFGAAAVVLQSFGKFLALVFLLVLMLFFGLTIVILDRIKARQRGSALNT